MTSYHQVSRERERERERENLRLQVWGSGLSSGGRWWNILEAEATKTLHIVVRGLPFGLECLYEWRRPVVNRKVATTVHIAGIPNRTDHGFMYGSAIHPTVGKIIALNMPNAWHGVVSSFSDSSWSLFWFFFICWFVGCCFSESSWSHFGSFLFVGSGNTLRMWYDQTSQ